MFINAEKRMKQIKPYRYGFIICFALVAGSPLMYAPELPLRPVAAINISLRQTIPSKIFTPNGDGINDLFTLIVDNPSGSVMSQKKIYDLSGFEIADLAVVGDETASTVVLTWNGKDNKSDAVPGGIYIYQLQSEGQSINGTVVVAR